MKKKTILLILILIIVLVTTILIIKNRKNNQNDSLEGNVNVEENINTEDPFAEEEIILAEYIEKLEDGVLKNNSEQLKEIKKVNGLEITNTRITGNKTEKEMTIMIDVKNTSKVVDGDKEVTFVMNDKEGKEIGNVGIYIETLQPQGVATLEIKTGLEFINTYSFTILDEPLSLPE